MSRLCPSRTLALLLLAAAAGCAAPPERLEPPPGQAEIAQLPTIPAARQWGDEPPRELQAWLSLPQETLRQTHSGVMGREHDYLVLSGGGGNGAFGAGLLAGWTAHGSRPEFQIVSGTSTGALIAPFAFLGPAYDATLREVYTRYSTGDLVEPRGLVRILRGDAALSTGRLRALIARYLDEEVIAAIAAEGARGRSLFVGTTNLDAGRPVVWDLTRIAALGTPEARELMYDVILASTAIPGAFPPVMIEVEVDGQRYDEMHVDGGVTSQLFLASLGIDWTEVLTHLEVQGAPDLYVIRNARIRQDAKAVPRRLVPVLTRTVSTLIRAQGIGDLAKLYAVSGEHGFNYHVAYIPDSFEGEPAETFDREYMTRLFEFGYELARSGQQWTMVPTGE
ncbi:patatin-like phospholipase family protein [Wenzhouxiangella sp. XN24]|uniref:patatin-like phospholipase family protein n=1 Tax=Wenzhouxiangella sp. XN24 TaxID=2713569 RepID=UPI0013ED88F7|nr:patatin [Wenzhouxiangella sp. XN24]